MAIPPNGFEIRRILVGNDPIIVKIKGGYEAHESGNAHAEEGIPSIIDRSYKVVEMVFHSGKADGFVTLNLMNNSSDCQWTQLNQFPDAWDKTMELKALFDRKATYILTAMITLLKHFV